MSMKRTPGSLKSLPFVAVPVVVVKLMVTVSPASTTLFKVTVKSAVPALSSTVTSSKSITSYLSAESLLIVPIPWLSVINALALEPVKSTVYVSGPSYSASSIIGT